MKAATFIVWLGSLCLLAGSVPAVSPWPAETSAQANILTSVDAGLNTLNWSGASWNPVTRTLWLACNSGYFWALVDNGAGGFRVATNAAGTAAKWSPGNDLESICQADYDAATVYLMDENGWIRAYNVSNYGVVAETRNWDIRVPCPEVGGASGPEGITFVPDEWLRREGFRGTNGNLAVSTNGMGGLMFVGHQDGGYVHVFDVQPTSSVYTYVGRYKTGRSETAGLEFDRTTGLLYLWHNTGSNYLEVTELSSYVEGAERRLRQVAEYVGPRSGNLEGFALLPTTESNHWCFVTDDDNSGGQAVMWYDQFQPAEDTDGDALPDGWELWHFGTTTQALGAADTDLDGLANAGEYLAGTDPTNQLSVFTLLEPDASRHPLSLRWSSVTGRVYTVLHVTELGSALAPTVLAVQSATSTVSQVSIDDSAPAGFYQVLVDRP